MTAIMEPEFLLERASLSRGRVNPELGVIYRVKILGPASKNGRTYTEAAMRNAVALYEGARVNIDHPRGAPSSPRGYEERIGVLRNVVFEGGALYGNLHINLGHRIAEQILWDAQYAPDACGLSHNVQAQTSRGVGGKVIVEEITRVLSVDLVADPATNSGLFESVDHEADDDEAEEFESARMTVAAFVEQVTGEKIPAVEVQPEEVPESFVAAACGEKIILEESRTEFVRTITR